MNDTVENRNRLSYIDVAKGILILLVVIGHVLTGSVFVTKIVIRIIGSFHVPAFFVISGFLTNEEKLGKDQFFVFIKKKARRLLIPYVVFELIGVFIQTVLIMPKSVDISEILSRILTVRCYIGADWFLVAMFFAELLLYLVVKYFRPKWHILLACGSFILAFFLSEPNWFMANCRRILASIGFILLGLRGKCFLELNSWRTFAFATIAFLLGAALNTGAPSIALRLFENPFFFVLCGWCGTYILLFISKQITAVSMLEKFLCQCGKASLIIMGTHQNVLIAYTLLYGQWSQITTKLLLLLVIMLFEFLIISLCKRTIPGILGNKQ